MLRHDCRWLDAGVSTDCIWQSNTFEVLNVKVQERTAQTHTHAYTHTCGRDGLGTGPWLLLKSHQPERGEQGREGNASNKKTVVNAATCAIYTNTHAHVHTHTHTHIDTVQRHCNQLHDLAWFRHIENVKAFMGRQFIKKYFPPSVGTDRKFLKMYKNSPSGISHWWSGPGVFTASSSQSPPVDLTSPTWLFMD